MHVFSCMYIYMCIHVYAGVCTCITTRYITSHIHIYIYGHMYMFVVMLMFVFVLVLISILIGMMHFYISEISMSCVRLCLRRCSNCIRAIVSNSCRYIYVNRGIHNHLRIYTSISIHGDTHFFSPRISMHSYTYIYISMHVIPIMHPCIDIYSYINIHIGIFICISISVFMPISPSSSTYVSTSIFASYSISIYMSLS